MYVRSFVGTMLCVSVG